MQAAVGATPAMEVTIGPTPGPGRAPPSQTNPYRGDRVATQEGRRWFESFNCVGCHGDHGGGGMGPSLRDQDWIYGDSDAHVFDSIAQGRAHGMPAWGTKIPESQIWQIVAYVQSLRTPGEPAKPDETIPPPPNPW